MLGEWEDSSKIQFAYKLIEKSSRLTSYLIALYLDDINVSDENSKFPINSKRNEPQYQKAWHHGVINDVGFDADAKQLNRVDVWG